MIKEEKTLDRLYVASPCPVDWDDMPGNDQVRFCNQCQLNVYNISAMSRKQAERLIAETEGRLCTKLYRRYDGTIITRDCPYGLRAIKRRVSRVASAALGAILGFFTNQTLVWADEEHKNCNHYTAEVVRLQSDQNTAVVNGIVDDINKAVITNAKVSLINEETKSKYDTQTDGEGKYRFSSLRTGTYTIIIESQGFRRFKKENLKIKSGEALQLNVTLEVGTMGGAAFLHVIPERGNDGTSKFTRRV